MQDLVQSEGKGEALLRVVPSLEACGWTTCGGDPGQKEGDKPSDTLSWQQQQIKTEKQVTP